MAMTRILFLMVRNFLSGALSPFRSCAVEPIHSLSILARGNPEIRIKFELQKMTQLHFCVLGTESQCRVTATPICVYAVDRMVLTRTNGSPTLDGVNYLAAAAPTTSCRLPEPIRSADPNFFQSLPNQRPVFRVMISQESFVQTALAQTARDFNRSPSRFIFRNG